MHNANIFLQLCMNNTDNGDMAVYARLPVIASAPLWQSRQEANNVVR
ncbi:hypothetical protein MJ8_24830 [Mesorhizobium sp. J8]|nr:hypothetical protein MJ8_24830 [Mesorhizobium sp. J8]